MSICEYPALVINSVFYYPAVMINLEKFTHFPNRSLLLRVLMGISKSSHKRTHRGEAVSTVGPLRIAVAPPKINMIFFTKVSEMENKQQSFPIKRFFFSSRIWKSHMPAQVSQIPIRRILRKSHTEIAWKSHMPPQVSQIPFRRILRNLRRHLRFPYAISKFDFSARSAESESAELAPAYAISICDC